MCPQDKINISVIVFMEITISSKSSLNLISVPMNFEYIFPS